MGFRPSSMNLFPSTFSLERQDTHFLTTCGPFQASLAPYPAAAARLPTRRVSSETSPRPPPPALPNPHRGSYAACYTSTSETVTPTSETSRGGP